MKDLLQAIDVLKREVQRQREEKEALEANVREQVVSEMMEVITGMQDGFRCVSALFLFTVFKMPNQTAFLQCFIYNCPLLTEFVSYCSQVISIP